MSGSLARDPRRREEGLTVIEVMVVTALLGMVMAVFSATLHSVQSNIVVQGRRSTNNDRAREALFSLDREIRSGNLVHNPASESLPNYELVVYTQANAPTRTPPNWCVQWRIETNKKLQQRRWYPHPSTGLPQGVTAWRVVAEDIVNRVENQPAFTSGGASVVNIVLLANVKHGAGATDTVRMTSSVAARNATPSTHCTLRPPG